MSKYAIKCREMDYNNIILSGGYLASTNGRTFYLEEFIEDAYLCDSLQEVKDIINMYIKSRKAKTHNWYTEIIDIS